ncbi:MAG: glycosyltransferase [Patescibacteria group bacterium]|jgi:glycosyltransferase involved in cell wall biosynthesis
MNKSSIALIHDHLAQNGGGERVLHVLQQLFPEAPTYTTVWNKRVADPVFLDQDIRTSFIQRLPFGIKKYQWYLPFMPVAFEKFDMTPYSLIISSNSALAKGIITPEGATHVCYCYTPTRYLWTDRNEYLDNLGLSRAVRSVLSLYLNYLRVWDLEAARRVDHFIAISRVVQERIKHYYKRDSTIIYPPVDLTPFQVGEGKGGYYITGGRLTNYKRFDVTVAAFSKLGIPLYVYGDGPEKRKLESLAHSNVKFLGRVNDNQLRVLYQNAIAFVNPQVEDFGLTMVEAQACGRPVIAFNQGGALDIVNEGVTGTFFDEQSWEALADTVIRFDPTSYDPKIIRAHAETFSVDSFKNALFGFLHQHHLIR